jgi:hypothetical protein
MCFGGDAVVWAMQACTRFLLIAYYVAMMLLTVFPLSWLLIEAARCDVHHDPC